MCVLKKEGEWELKNIFYKKKKHNKPQFIYFVESASLRKRHRTLTAVKTYNMTHVDIWTRDSNGFLCATEIKKKKKNRRITELECSAVKKKRKRNVPDIRLLVYKGTKITIYLRVV